MIIVHTIFSFNTGGTENMLIDIVNEQVKNNKVFIIIINNRINQDLIYQINKKVKIIYIGRHEKSKNPIPVFKLNWHILTIHPDVIHCHQESLIKIIFCQKKCFLTVHAMNIETKNLSHYHKVIAISKAVKSNIEQRSDCKPDLIYNGINLQDIRYKKNYDFDIYQIIQIGRLDHMTKGQHVLIEALDVLINKRGIKNIKVDFIGDGDSLNYLQEIVLNYKLSNHVNFLKSKNKSYIYNNLKHYSLLVQPSLHEGFGLTVVEGMAAKIPVLVSNIDGPIEIIRQGELGWLFQSGNCVDCADKITYLMNNNHIISDKINKAFDEANNLFNIKDTTSKYITLYKATD